MTPALDEKFLSSTIMIGDKNYDIFGAKANKITSAGAAWGYGSLDELADAGADFILKRLMTSGLSAHEIGRHILQRGKYAFRFLLKEIIVS
ncbi:MAG: hypothetical protein ACLUIQ_01835 [Dialister invisus]